MAYHDDREPLDLTSSSNYQPPIGERRISRRFLYTAVILLSLCVVCLVVVLIKQGTDAHHSIELVAQEQLQDEKAVGERLEKVCLSVVVIESQRGDAVGGFSVGTGVVLSEDGFIATNLHVIDKADSVQVTFRDGKTVAAVLVDTVDRLDLAVLKVNRSGLQPAQLAKAKDCYLGQGVYAIGTPANARYGWTVSKGIISCTDRHISLDGSANHISMLQTDVAVNHGNSGGPLVNAAGQVVGLVTTKLANDYQGVSFAIPSETVVEALSPFLTEEWPDSTESSMDEDTSSPSEGAPALGIQGQFLEKGNWYVHNSDGFREADAEAIDDGAAFSPFVSGVYILSLNEGTDAAAKLTVGEIIVDINGKTVLGMDTVAEEIGHHQVGDTVTITCMRGETASVYEVILGTAP